MPAALRRLAPFVPALAALVLWATAPLVVPLVPGPDSAALADAALTDAEDALTGAWAATDARARRVARDPAVAAALTGDTPDALGTLVRRFAATPPPPRVSVEVWRDSLLYTWQGASAQTGGAGQTGPALRDGLILTETRTVLRRVEPVDGIEGGRVVVTWTVRETPPVRNASLRPYDLIRTATRARGLDVRLDTAQQATESTAPDERTRTRTVTGTGANGAQVALGILSAEVAPRTPQLARRVDDVRTFWGVVGAFALAGAVLGRWRRSMRRRHGRVATWTTALVAAIGGVRTLLLALDVPARWQHSPAPFAPLFDPERFATPVALGLARSLGDLVVTVATVLLAAAVATHGLAAADARTRGAAPLPARALASTSRIARALLIALGAALAGAGIVGAAGLLATLAARALLDSTLPIFSRATLWPSRDVTLLLAALLGATLAAFWTARALIDAARLLAVRVGGREGARWASLGTGGMFGAVAATWMLGVPARALGVAAVVTGVAVWAARPAAAQARRSLWPGGLRAALPAVLVAAALLYPLLYAGLAAQRQAQMDEAAGSVERDARVLFDLTDVLRHAQDDPTLRDLLAGPAPVPGSVGDSARRARLDARAAALVRDALLGSYGPYDVGLVVLDKDGRLAGRYAEGLSAPSDVLDLDEFALLRAMQAGGVGDGTRGAESADPFAPPASDLIVEPVTGRREADRFQYLGLARLDSIGFVTARAEPAPRTRDFETPFPRVLLPDGAAGVSSDLAVAQFRDGVFVRGIGQDFGRARLDEATIRATADGTDVWRTERDRTGRYRVLYRAQPDSAATLADGPLGGLADAGRVVAVRAPLLTIFDHLFFALRLALVGFALALMPVAIAVARRPSVWPPRRFRDRVLGAFLAVGGVAVVAVALVGRGVVVSEQARATDAWLAQSLERVEEALTLDAPPGALAYRQLERASVDSLARRLDLDLNVYRGPDLVATSRPVLLRDGLLDPRLPVGAYEALGFDGQRFVALDARLGTFRYRAGYRALLDESGRPVYVLSVPTLPEQERLEAEQSRMQAYLFGALLVLLILLLGTATLFARALAQPVARLREGLETVARGRFDTPIPETRDDEMGDLARTFNAMQAQLAESRRQLAQQERQLAWREMARQVAHEIKNPLTPMKLSVQHLRRAYDDGQAAEGLGAEAPPAGKFARMFDRVTTTLLEQIDALTRIASDFSTFARLPRRVAEPLDVSRVAADAVALMEADADGADVIVVPAPAPLVVEADREEMRRVFINLVKNAIQATDGCSVRRVTVSSRADGAFAVVDVADTGSGIAEADRERIFVPNFSTKTSGTGLGLAIARQAVEASGGTISFETTGGAGTTFTVRLPLAPTPA